MTLAELLRTAGEEIAPIDLDDSDQRLATWLELRLRGPLARAGGS